MAPFGIQKILNWINENYAQGTEIIVTENGFSDQQGNLDDLQRIYFYKHYINHVLKGEQYTVQRREISLTQK